MKKLIELLNLKKELGITDKIEINLTESGKCCLLEIGNKEWTRFIDENIEGILQEAINDLKEDLEEKKTENIKTIEQIEKRIA